LLRMEPVKAKIDAEKVKQEIAELEKVVVIAYFVGGQQSSRTLMQWLAALRQEAHEELALGRDLGQGFFQISYKSEAAIQKVLMRTPITPGGARAYCNHGALALIPENPKR
jgi:hypothetical protein